MTETSARLSSPEWIYKRDGRLVPFEADKISRSLFAAGESLGRPDAFTSRELTDSALYFIAAEADGTIPTTAQVAETVAKVVRELGHPALARAFTEGRDQKIKAGVAPAAATPSWSQEAGSSLDLARRSGGALLRDYSLREVFTRDLVAAHNDGLLVLTGLEAPRELAGWALSWPGAGHGAARSEGLVEAIEEGRHCAGGLLAIDGPEYALAGGSSAAAGMPTGEGWTTARFARELGVGLRATCLHAVVNLNCAARPGWADDLAAGPLFGRQGRDPGPEIPEGLSDELAERLTSALPVRVAWHLGERDFAGGEGRLLRVARRALEGAPLTFVFDRPRRPVSLAEGLDRRHPGLLLSVGLNLPALARQPGAGADAAVFLQKLGSLARLALSAAVQKRDFLRRHSRRQPALARGFLLDRARLVVVPVGLETVVRGLAGQGMCAGGAGLDLARKVVQRLVEVLEHDGQAYRMDACVDSAADFCLDGPAGSSRAAPDPERSGPDTEGPLPARPESAEQVAGLTPWEVGAGLKAQLKAAHALHTAAAAGTAAGLLGSEQEVTPEEFVEVLRYAWEQTAVGRWRLVRPGRRERQLHVPWPDRPDR